MSARTAPARRPLDPDELAALEEEREFLLRSIEDLDREHAAGDVDDADHRALRDDYTARAAAVLHAIEDRRTAIAEAGPPPRPLRTAAIVAAVLVVAGLSGWAVARAAGDRSEGEEVSGGVLESVGQQLTTCLMRSQSMEDPVDTLECYDAILEEHPANVEALTYRGWFLVRAGLAELGWPDLQAAVAIDPDYPDARVFRAVALNRLCRPDEALAELEAFEALDPLPEMRALVTDFELRDSIAELREARDATPSVAGAPSPADEVDVALDQCPTLAEAGLFDGTDAAPTG